MSAEIIQVIIAAEGEVVPMICPFCQHDDHWNHQRESQKQPSRGPGVTTGECRAYDTISEHKCACTHRPPRDDPQ